MLWFLRVLISFVACAGVLSCSGADSAGRGSPSLVGQVPPISIRSVTFTGAGDLDVCRPGAEATARLLDRIPGSVFSLGDYGYPVSDAQTLATCYEPTWGRHRARTFPAPGNHDWDAQLGAPYFAYFGPAAGPSGTGYYSVDLGAWHILSLNSNASAQPGSPQYEWLRQDLERGTGPCALAYWHHPVFSSGPHGNNPHMGEIWRLLDLAGVDVVLVGHEHSYERFAPQDADGRPDADGIRQFVVGTGGVSLRPFSAVHPNSEARNSDTFGVLTLALHALTYEWEFVPVDGQSFSDVGFGACIR